MFKLKGPIKILEGDDNKQFFNKMNMAGVVVKLPFEATGFNSTKAPDLRFDGITKKSESPAESDVKLVHVIKGKIEKKVKKVKNK